MSLCCVTGRACQESLRVSLSGRFGGSCASPGCWVGRMNFVVVVVVVVVFVFCLFFLFFVPSTAAWWNTVYGVPTYERRHMTSLLQGVWTSRVIPGKTSLRPAEMLPHIAVLDWWYRPPA
ncbi:hypothetical protein BO70DRAFT_229986 [Aspergillus heteromorphus CBS 117.55]|uniref:Uncharacterized protein n=1 Tax=Aspergillus heteromorphus CBS 117.55 TaxID=1448321 RepID=A0A317WG04_9EURO|nr:uncharacterized protein BO70DRAFT_229986 [Aspergillus heteromorphus CBS 117.55]PWY84895.1 hypothetical protein BO70DRAFT_229986 [Aspergillus heteromorphus CBS 117.55]